MADVDVTCTDALIISALNTPGGAVHEWRDDVMERIVAHARATSPVNHPMNAAHRGGLVGTYAAGWHTSRAGSNGHRVRATITNDSDHAVFVEYGRQPSHGYERFSWVVAGGMVTARHGTRGYPAKHILRDAANAVLPGATGGTVGLLV